MGQMAEQHLSDAERLVRALEASSPSEAYGHLLAYADRNDLPETPAGLGPEEALLRSGIDPAQIPADLIQPVGRIWSAILVAEDMQAEATGQLTEEEVRVLTDGTVWTLIGTSRDVAEADDGQSIGTATGHKTQALSNAEHKAIIDKVDRDLMAAAALHLLQALERNIPDMMDSLPASQPVLQPNACDAEPQVNLVGLIAIDGTGSALFDEDYLLSVDLGGNDCYNNTAGGASAGISIAIDLAGNDHYVALGNTSEPVVAHGAANLGIGILVDVSGDDMYIARVETTAPEPGPIAEPATVIAQGGGANVGIGVFVDLGGADHIESHTFSSGNNATIIGQGGGEDIGIGVAVAGGGETDWIVNATSIRHIVIERPFYREFLIGGGDFTGHGGGGAIGIGALVDLSGDDHYDVVGSGGRSLIRAQGAGNGGIGVLADVVGEDTYDIFADGFEELVTIVDSTMFCWNAFTILETEDTEVLAQGSGSAIGIGILADVRGPNAGNTFTVESRTGAHARTEVQASADPSVCTNRANTTATTGSATVLVQGAAETGVGVLIGSLESDVYTAETSVDAEAVALVHVGATREENADATAGDSTVHAQGYADLGIGILLDAIGDESYHWDTFLRSVEITSSGTTNGTMGEAHTHGQGYIEGLISIGWLLDLEGDDEYALEVAGNDSCWTHPDSGGDPLNILARGRDWSLLSDPLTICV